MSYKSELEWKQDPIVIVHVYIETSYLICKLYPQETKEKINRDPMYTWIHKIQTIYTEYFRKI